MGRPKGSKNKVRTVRRKVRQTDKNGPTGHISYRDLGEAYAEGFAAALDILTRKRPIDTTHQIRYD